MIAMMRENLIVVLVLTTVAMAGDDGANGRRRAGTHDVADNAVLAAMGLILLLLRLPPHTPLGVHSLSVDFLQRKAITKIRWGITNPQ